MQLYVLQHGGLVIHHFAFGTRERLLLLVIFDCNLISFLGARVRLEERLVGRFQLTDVTHYDTQPSPSVTHHLRCRHLFSSPGICIILEKNITQVAVALVLVAFAVYFSSIMNWVQAKSEDKQKRKAKINAIRKCNKIQHI